MSMAQGGDFFGYHAKQHGGMAPVGYTGMLDDALRGSARVSPLDQAGAAILGLKDQAGGRRQKRATKKRATKKRATRSKRATRRRRRTAACAPSGAWMLARPPCLLQGPQAQQALSTMNQDWRAAQHRPMRKE
jgi:hypothetical protein